MKKLLALLLTLSMVFALAACGGNDNKPSDSSNTPTDTNTPAPDANTQIGRASCRERVLIQV